MLFEADCETLSGKDKQKLLYMASVIFSCYGKWYLKQVDNLICIANENSSIVHHWFDFVVNNILPILMTGKVREDTLYIDSVVPEDLVFFDFAQTVQDRSKLIETAYDMFYKIIHDGEVKYFRLSPNAK